MLWTLRDLLSLPFQTWLVYFVLQQVVGLIESHLADRMIRRIQDWMENGKNLVLDGEMAETLPQCRNCKNFFITHEPAQPYGCRAMGFKSRRIPSLVVFETSGMHCQLYAPKSKTSGPLGPLTSRFV